ncbi:MAG: hypothetical protein DHS20C13_26590 [Thermodesulfobacteriota bacterium]|nr:MAG: hypothetical protein DHS20C13_26590 [Thermodesulfobacteriota bacterium]
MDLTEFIYTCDKCKKGYFRVADASATFTTTTQVVINGQLQNHPRNNETIQNVFICRDFLNAFLDQCAEHNIDGLVDTSEKIECQQCEENYMPEVVTDDRHMCFDRAYVDTKKGNSDDFTNCYRVEYNKNV